MIALLAALLLAAPETPAAHTPPPDAAALAVKPANIENAVDANGVPAWAKRKHLKPVQGCTSRPNIGVQTWREEYDSSGKKLRSVPIKTTCKP
ncbi:hypothetical protein [Phenylobacterium sp.]|uniref:hypothetical protein n=1 Tax=Phenylobacterium sp. TaxID=1871053 RepID=UPI0025D9C07D|nr:hypothetical protein [Phenylobacterium sp.]